jgi:hypothetical protein
MVPPVNQPVRWIVDFLETADGRFNSKVRRITRVNGREETVEEFRVEDPEAYLRLRS